MPVVSQSQIDALESGLDSALAAIQDQIAKQVLAEQIPLVGAGLKAAYDLPQTQAALASINAFRTAVRDALGRLNDAADYAESTVENAISGALSAAGFSGDLVDVAVSGADVSLTFAQAKDSHLTLDLAHDLGLPGLGIETSGSVDASLHYAINLGVGVDSSGFYAGTSGSHEIGIGVRLDGSDLAADAQLGPLSFSATDTGSNFDGTFSVDLLDANQDGKLRLNELSGDLVDARLDATADVRIDLHGDMGSAALPQLDADLLVDWDFSASTVNPDDGNASFGGTPTVSFQNVTLDMGSFVHDFVEPVLQQIVPVLQPINQALAILNSDIGVLKSFSGWREMFERTGDDKVTLIDLLKVANPGLDIEPIQKFMGMVGDVLSWAEFLASTSLGPKEYVIGDFTLSGADDIRSLAFQLSNASATFGGFKDTLSNVLSGLSGQGWGVTDPGSGLTAKDILDQMATGTDFSLPILKDPAQIIKLLLGGQADLFHLDLPEVHLSASNPTLALFPVFPGINVTVGGSIGAAFDLAFGFDTRGLLTADGDPLKVLNGFYLVDGSGTEVKLDASISLSVALDFLIASLVGGGDITGEIDLDLADGFQHTPGKLYLDELLGALTTNPFAIFDASGQITAGFSANATVLFGEVWRLNSPRITLGAFTFDGTGATTGPDGEVVIAPPPPPPELASFSDGTLTLNIGARAGLRAIADNTDHAESALVADAGGALGVQLLSHIETFSDVALILGDAGGGDDEVVLSEDLAISARLGGGLGDDMLGGGAADDTLDGGEDDDILTGNSGNDTLRGGGGKDVLLGGSGADALDGGAGQDIASYRHSAAGVTINSQTGVLHSGDAEGDTLAGIEVIEGSGHGDTLVASNLGGMMLLGAGGDDSLTGGTGKDDVLMGGAGNDLLVSLGSATILIGGMGDDTYRVDSTDDVIAENLGGEVPSGSDSGTDLVMASVDWTLGDLLENLTITGAARVAIGNALANTITGTAGNDTIDSGGGIDLLIGGQGDDTYRIDRAGDHVTESSGAGRDTIEMRVANFTGVVAGAAVFDMGTDAANVENLVVVDGGRDTEITGNALGNEVRGNAAMDTLHGGDGDDILDGGSDGGDHLFGDGGDDTIQVSFHSRDVEVDGGAGIDRLVMDWSGATNSIVFFSDVCYQTYKDGVGWIWLRHVGNEAFTLKGGIADDDLRGGDRDDTLIGNAGHDELHGGAGRGVYDGGAGQDVAWAAISQDGGVASTRDFVLTLKDAQNGPVTVNAGTSVETTWKGVEVLRLDLGSGNDTVDVRGVAFSAYVTGYAHSISAGAGDDSFALDLLSLGDSTFAGGEGTDTLTLDWSTATNAVTFDSNSLYGQVFYNTFADGFGWIHLTTTGVERWNLTGGALDDDLRGGALDDRLVGGTGSDELRGFGGRDSFDGGAGQDVVFTTVSTNAGVTTTLDFSLVLANTQAATVTVNAGTSVETKWRGIEAVQIVLGSGNDLIDTRGVAADARVTGYAHSVTGAGGNDTFATDLLSLGALTFDGGEGADTLILDWSKATNGVGFSDFYATTNYQTFVDGWGWIAMNTSGVERWQLSGGSGNDLLRGGTLDDRLSGAAGQDQFFGQGGATPSWARRARTSSSPGSPRTTAPSPPATSS
ncbi:secreted hemolysin-type calcium-binding protein bacteriocin, putative [Rubellimicrobium mesophilum DSM 19309]|uniref:Secreted hemolysin-type calcium-binding protein bacteriocin, putative n=1 Tax=Rubellimicrobium mesophilum DSM 19309 TaxID=442562 RepID=A0A017HMU6_9RHOB|nr:calcium-binding protein [Rubellimicrobium mesophilum]EYD75630.1 secreted hemolysin-type calcium-binding protein bacteriocin, putative [Rubellimicrobium mesophilum DSM 19309]